MNEQEMLKQINERVSKLPEEQQRMIMATVRGMELANEAAKSRADADPRSA